MKVPADLADDIDGLAAGRTLRQGLSLANKAGAVVTGFAKVEAAIAGKPVVALIHATEAAEDGRKKARGQLRKRFGEAISAFRSIQDFSNRRIGFGIGPVKCDTCCARRGRWQRRLSERAGIAYRYLLRHRSRPDRAAPRRSEAGEPDEHATRRI